MRYILALFVFTWIFSSCHNGSSGSSEDISGIDSNAWVKDFKDFRSAVYAHNVEKVKSYFDFPVIDSDNSIWFIVLDTAAYKKIDINTVTPFTEKDFYKYYDKLFTKDFIKSILKIKSEDLYKTGHAKSPEFDGEGDTSYKETYLMNADYDSQDSLLGLYINYYYHPVLSSQDSADGDDEDDNDESSKVLYFKIIDHKRLRFYGATDAD
ncbi:MAG TPA: hypothetical protein VN922_15995 [Bacteroidia bacterium]|nr:hypothetical protein [Bacteroidia bacterium]